MGKVPRGLFEESPEFVLLHLQPAVEELADRLASPELEPPWTPSAARKSLFITFIEQQESRGRRAGRTPLPARPNDLGGVFNRPATAVEIWQSVAQISTHGFSAQALAEYRQAVLDASCGADWRDFEQWLRAFEENETEPFEIKPPREYIAGPDGLTLEPTRWGGQRPKIRGGDRAEILRYALELTRDAVKSWGADYAEDALWDELARVVGDLAQHTVTGKMLAELARPRRRSTRGAEPNGKSVR